MHDRAATTVLTTLGSLAGHHGGDYLVQADCWAQAKQQRTPAGRRALAAHAATYAATQAVTKAAFYRAAGVRVPLLAQLAGAVVEGVLHAVIDDGRLLRRFSDATGKRRFHDLADHGVNGRMLLDQAAHQQLQIPAGTIATVAVAAWLARRAR
jgi:hypothetical protein